MRFDLSEILCNKVLLKYKRDRKQWHPTPVLLPGKSHGQRSLVGCSPRGRWESDTTEQLHFHVSLLCIGEENGILLQCSCLENPRDRGARWAAVYGVAQSRTRLKWLSSSMFGICKKDTNELIYKRETSNCIAQGALLNVMWQPGWDRSLGENGYMHMCGWVPRLSFIPTP